MNAIEWLCTNGTVTRAVLGETAMIAHDGDVCAMSEPRPQRYRGEVSGSALDLMGFALSL